MKRIIPVMMAAVLTCASVPMVAKADNSKVVTLGANLSDEQKKSMYEYFGTSSDKVETIEVTNADERKYMEGIASEDRNPYIQLFLCRADWQRRCPGKSG